MKILYIANIRLPTERAHGLQIMQTCASFKNANVELVIPTRRNILTTDPFVHYGVPHTFSLTKIVTPDWVRFGRIGFLLSALWFSEKARWLSSFRRADVVYSRDAFVLFQYLLLPITTVFEAHAKPTFWSRLVARRASRVVVISEGLAAAYVAAGVAPSRIVVAPDAVDPNLFTAVPARSEARAILGLPQRAHVVVYAGHLYTRKGVDTLAAAAIELPDVEFVFVGGMLHDAQAFAEKWASAKNIRVVGHVTHDVVPLYLRAADTLVLPNSGLDEDAALYTSPMKLFEYMASGTPIVASDVPAIREILSPDDCFFVAPDDPHALAEQIGRLRDDRMSAERSAMRALDLARAYTWEARAEKIERALVSSKDETFFNKESEQYSQKRYPNTPTTFTQFFFKERLEQTIRLLNSRLPVSGAALLEVGCADGVVARAIWRAYKDRTARFDANDTAREMIEVARRESADTPITFSVRGEGSNTGPYDAIIELGVLNYTDSDVDTADAARLLLSRGQYICSVAGSSSLQHRLKGSAGYLHLRAYVEYEQGFKKYFSIEKRVPVGFFIPYLWKVPMIGRVLQPVVERVGRTLFPSFALEYVYVLTPHA